MTNLSGNFDILVMAYLFRSKPNPDGSPLVLPGAETIAQAMADKVRELLKGDGAQMGTITILEWNLPKQVWVPAPQPKPEPPVVATWPKAGVACQQIINAMNSVGLMGSIPPDIFREMTVSQASRDSLYASLKSKRPLQEWKLSPDRLIRVVLAFRERGLLD